MSVVSELLLVKVLILVLVFFLFLLAVADPGKALVSLTMQKAVFLLFLGALPQLLRHSLGLRLNKLGLARLAVVLQLHLVVCRFGMPRVVQLYR